MRIPSSSILSRHRIQLFEPFLWLFALSVLWLFPKYLALATSILIMALFALSYDVVIGFAGILSLGQAMFFGIGSYSAALIALAGWREPITGALAAGLISATVAAVLAPLVLRLKHLPLIMVTVALNAIAFEAANKATSITNGDDGLSGFEIDPLFGYFRWSIFGQTKYLYVLGWLFISFYLIRRLAASPFGVALQGIRENPVRMRLVGNAVLLHQSIAFAIGGGFAGIAGALMAQTNTFVGLQVMSLDTTFDGLVMVVLGGIGSLYGGLIGAPVYLAIKHFAQQWSPYYWMFLVGMLLIVVMRFARGGLVGMIESLTTLIKRRRSDDPRA